MVSEALGFSESRSTSDEDRSLVEFCNRLGSTSGTVSNDDQTRRGAELLMMLSFIPNDEIIEPLPPCASDSSFSSASSRDSRSFGFSCPSLSLEHPAVSHDFGDSPTKATVPITTNLYPATLLERTLKVDDRDASRLSADAMARNILQSFQKAMDWRIGAWMKALSASLLESTQDQVTFGGSVDVNTLLQTPQGTILLALRNIQEENHIKVLQTSTTFEVAVDTQTPGTKERETDEYEVTKPIKLCSQVYLSTPLGYSEIEISTPGHVKGCFSEGELAAVKIDLDTEILAVMMEKGCRKIVRSCVEQAVKQLEKQRVPAEQVAAEESSPNTTEVPFTMSTPPQDQSALVTPHTTSTFVATKETTNSKILLPNHLDLNQHAPLRRRITPQSLSTRDLISPPPPSTRTFEYSSPDDETTTTPARKRARRAPLVSPTAGDSVYHEIGQDGPSLPTLVEVACRARTADC